MKKNRLVTKIWWRDGWCNVKPDKSPIDTRQLDSFLIYNHAAKCFMKGQGGWYKITKENSLLYVCRALYLLSFKDWLEIAKNDYFIANIKVDCKGQVM